MVNRFLTGAITQGVSEEELQDGSINIIAKTLTAQNLEPNKNVITNASGELITVDNTDPADDLRITVLENKTQKIEFDDRRFATEIKGDLILSNDDGFVDAQRGRITGDEDIINVFCDLLVLSDNLRVTDTLTLVRSVIDVPNPIDINGNNTAINYKIINTRAGSQDKDILRYDQLTNTFVFSDTLTTVENDIQLIETNKNFFNDQITLTDSVNGTVTTLTISNDSVKLLDTQNVPQIQISNIETIFGDTSGVVSLSDRILTTPSTVNIVNDTNILGKLTIATGANRYELPVDNLGANNNDVLIYNSSNRRLEFGPQVDPNVNIFDQSLNTNDDVTFNRLTVSDHIEANDLTLNNNIDTLTANIGINLYVDNGSVSANPQKVIVDNDFKGANFTNLDNSNVPIITYVTPALNNRVAFDFTGTGNPATLNSGISINFGGAIVANNTGGRVFYNLDTGNIQLTRADGSFTTTPAPGLTRLIADYTGTVITVYDPDNTDVAIASLNVVRPISDANAIRISGNGSTGDLTFDNLTIQEYELNSLTVGIVNGTVITNKIQDSSNTLGQELITKNYLETTEILFDPFEVVNNNDFFTDANFTFRYDSVNKQLTWRNNRDTGNPFYDISNVLEGAQNIATSTYVVSTNVNTFRYFGTVETGNRDANFDINPNSYGQINRMSIVNELPGEPLYKIEIYYHNTNSLVGDTRATMIIKKINNFI